MICARAFARVALQAVLLALPPALPAAHAAVVGVQSYGVRLQTRVKSIQEIRHDRVVLQKWDKSCGAAALSTLLTFYLDIPVNETAIIGNMVRHGDPLRVRRRGGFSLLDLKRYVQRQGYQGQGYGGMSLAELVQFKTPAIVPIRTHGYDHFVIFVAQSRDRVVLADPAFGNLTLTARQFERVWQNGIAFMVFRDEVRAAQTTPLTDPRLPIPQLSSVERVWRGMGPVPATRVGR